MALIFGDAGEDAALGPPPPRGSIQHQTTSGADAEEDAEEGALGTGAHPAEA